MVLPLLLVAALWAAAQSSAGDRTVPDGAAAIPGVTELMLAAAEAPVGVVRELLSDATSAGLAAADANGNTVLHWAAFFATDPAVLDALLDAGAPVDVRNAQGLTAFEIIQGNDALVGSDAYRRLLTAKLERRGR